MARRMGDESGAGRARKAFDGRPSAGNLSVPVDDAASEKTTP
jgi:hypothetical protein